MNKIRTPKLPLLILGFISEKACDFSAIGDLNELFYEKVSAHGRIVASYWLWWQVVRSIPVFLINSLLWRMIMLHNYIKIAMRNINKHKTYALLNITGLAAGMACFILIMLWVQHEMSYDRFNKQAVNTYRVLLYYPDSNGYSWSGPGPLADYLTSNYPEIVNGSMVFSDVTRPLKYQDKLFSATLCGSEPSFFEIFSYTFLKGGLETSFEKPNYIILTEETAHKYFGDKNPLGESMIMDWWGRWLQFEVTGVINNVPQNSHLQFDYVIPFAFVTASGMKVDDWKVRAYKTYVVLDHMSRAEEVNKKIAGDLRKHDPDNNALLHLQPLTAIHLHNPDGGGPVTYVYTFSIIGVLILLIACINFMNLASARSISRAKEIGLRKVIGSTRHQLIRQCLIEANINSLVALLLATVLVLVALPSINTIVGINLNLFHSPVIILYLLGISLITGTLSGIYPAFIVSKYQPVEVIKGTVASAFKAPTFRKILVTIQFTISILLIICVLVVFNQINYIRSKDLGFDKEYVINLEIGGDLYENFDVIKQELEAHADILSVTRTNFSYSKGFGTSGIQWEGKTDNEQTSASMHSVDYNFLEIFDIEMAQGRFFSKEFPTDATENVVLNETAVKTFGISNPVDKHFYCPLPLNQVRDGKIIGVIKDYNFKSLHSTIKPLILAIVPYWYSDVYIRIRSTNIPNTIAIIEKTVREVDPNYLFEYRFLHEEIDKLYKTEQRMGTLIKYGTFLAIFISCLGLFGLASFTVEQRKKEISIRKVLGASIKLVMILLLKQFTKWILLANIFAWPLAYFVMREWLKNFAYKTDLTLKVFLLSSVLALCIAILTVSYQTVKAACLDPAESLKYE